MESPDWSCDICGQERVHEQGATYCINKKCPACPADLKAGTYVPPKKTPRPDFIGPIGLLLGTFNLLSRQIFQLNHKWWHDAGGNRLDRNPAELICLMHSELSEAMEGERKDLMDDHLPHRKMCEVEMADTIIRILDFCGSRGYDIQGAIEEKLVYNQSRADHSHEARDGKNGKRF